MIQYVLSLVYKYYDRGANKRNSFIHKIHELFFSSSFLVYFFFLVKISPEISSKSNFKNLKHKFDLTTILLKLTLKKLIKKDHAILEVGTGAFGLLSIYFSKFSNKIIDSTDISKENIESALINIKFNKANINLFTSNIFENVVLKYDIIFWNVPYYYPKKEYLHPLIDEVHKHLNDEGILIIGYNSNPLKENDIINYTKSNKELKYYKTVKFIWNRHLISLIKKK